jgi:hypothetical protein
MEQIEVINNIINTINNIRKEEFINYNLEFEEKKIEKKPLSEDIVDVKYFKNKIYKKALQDKHKPSNIGKKEYPSAIDGINILEDDIFSNENDDNPPEEDKLDIEKIDRNKKIELINEFIQRKNIIFDEEDSMEKIINIVDNPEIILKKYINISKIYQQITKISFIKKLENGTYIINLNDTKVKKSKNLFLNKK